MKRKTAIAILLAAAATFAAAVQLSDEEIEICEASGGCALITKANLYGLIKQAFKEGQKSCGNFI